MGRWIIVGLAALVLAAGLVAWLVMRGDGGSHAGSRLRVLFSGETMGELEPCNCSGKMAGGLPARGGYVETVEGDRLLLDTGCIGAGSRDFEVLRTEAALRGMAAMRYDAANLGESELWLGRDRLADLGRLGVPLVSANVRGEDGAEVVPSCLVLRRSGLRVIVTGVVESGRYQVGPGLAVEKPREALGRLIPEWRKMADAIIVLADLDLAAVKDLAADFPEITLILFRGRGDSHPPERINRTIIASVYGEARYLGDLALEWASATEASAAGQAVLLDERFAPSQAVAEACIGWYKDAVRGRRFDPARSGPTWNRIAARQPEPLNRYVGSEACRGCHAAEFEKWSAGAHARAMESLRRVGYEFSPECIACHATGYGASDGYMSIDETPALARVGCEACHGRGQVMVAAGHKGIARSRGEERCRECHTPKRHEQFNFDKAWATIRHGGKP